MLGKKRITTCYFAGGLALSLLLGRPGLAADLLPDAVGVRAAYSITTIDRNYVQTQLFADWDLPWRSERTNGWYFATGLDLALGDLKCRDSVAFVGSLGPTLRVGYGDFPVFVEGGCSPTMLSRHEFGVNNYGCNFQFTTYGGVGVALGRRWEMACRFQHMSNAGLAQPNPGLNLLGLSLRYNF